MPTPQDLLAELARGHRAPRLRHVAHRPERAAAWAEWPTWISPVAVGAFTGAGAGRLWSHQRTALDLIGQGRHTVLATGTASGKSLAYLAPALSWAHEGSFDPGGRGATVLYLSPTKALAADQLTRIEALAVPGVRAATYDGDTPPDERRWVRDHANIVLSNPDLLHHSLLPGHERWSRFLRSLKLVVIDECHTYRGVFGTHVSAVLRRLTRICARYGAQPTFVLASATVASPAQHASALIGMPCVAVVDDGSPRAGLTLAFWEPPTIDGARRSATTEAAELLSELVARQVQTVAFARSRAGVEALATSARRRLEELDPTAVERVAAYRGGYLPGERRALEADLRSGRLVGLAATNALELGVDVSGLDAVIVAGWPGRRASLWQQVGRAGRSGTEALAIFVAADDPLDTYLLGHPQAVLDAPVEATVMDPANPVVIGPHLAAAAAELPLTPEDLELFGPHARRLVDAMVAKGILRRRPRGWFWAREDRPAAHISLRGAESVVSVVEAGSGRVLGTVDAASAHTQVHTGAVHVHQGDTWVVTDLDLGSGIATVVRGDPGWTTHAQSISSFRIVTTDQTTAIGRVAVCRGVVTVTSQVTGFLRRLPGGEILGVHALDLPERTLTTRAVWWTLPEDLLAAEGVDAEAIPGAAHAAEHAAIGLLPLVAAADRWDIGGVSTACHPDTGLPTIMVYDGYPGGAGFADRAFEVFPEWVRATRESVSECACDTGCPACVQSPKCGNGNEPLDKAGAITLLRVTAAP